MDTNKSDRKQVSRFHPMRILLICGLQGFIFGFLALIGIGIYGFFVGTVLPIVTIAKIAGVAFVVGLISGAIKL